MVTTRRLVLLYCSKHLLHFDEARRKEDKGIVRRGWEVVDEKSTHGQGRCVFTSENQMLQKGETATFLNKIIDNFVATMVQKLWPREQNSRKGMEWGRGLKRIRRIQCCFLRGKRRRKKNIDDTRFHSSALPFLCSSPRSTAG